jgi:hypothetical protein
MSTLIRRRLTAEDLEAISARAANLGDYGLAKSDLTALIDEVALADEQLGDCWTLLHEMLACRIPLPRGFTGRIQELLTEQECPGYGHPTDPH